VVSSSASFAAHFLRVVIKLSTLLSFSISLSLLCSRVMRRVCDLISTLTSIYYVVVVVVRKSPKRPHFCADDGKNKHVKTKKKKNTAALFLSSLARRSCLLE
jgi:hypothetical protein